MMRYSLTLLDPSGAKLDEISLKKHFSGEFQWLECPTSCRIITKMPEVRINGVDIIVEPYPPTPKKLLICDMDSTMIGQECIDELADFAGVKEKVSAITERAMRGELDFAEALNARVALLKDLPESVLEECYRTRISFSPGARELVQGMHRKGAHTALVSGGFTFFTSRVAEALGFHEHHANVLEVEDGKLTGRVVLPILGKEAKLAKMMELCRELNISTEQVMAIGDGANDLPMLEAAGLGVAYRAKPLVQERAKARLNYNGLDALLMVA